jgi:hypothetical protein
MKIKSLISAAVLSLVFAAPAIASANPELSVTPQSVLKGEPVTYHVQGATEPFSVVLKPSACKPYHGENHDEILGHANEAERTIEPDEFESLGPYHLCLYLIRSTLNSSPLSTDATFEVVTSLPLPPVQVSSPTVGSIAPPTVASEPTTGLIVATHAAVPSRRVKAIAKCKRLNRHKRKKLTRCLRKAKRLR